VNRASAARTWLIAGALVAIAGAQAAGIEDLPKRKPGLWEMTMLSAEGKRGSMTGRVCIDAATDAALTSFGLGMASQMCSKRDIRVSGNIATIDMVCKVGESQQTSHSTITYTGNDSYRINMRAHFEPPFLGKSDSTMTQAARWTGACPADMKPGDLVMANGMKINLKDMAGARP
jgi:uncharacterized protein DUF3617